MYPVGKQYNTYSIEAVFDISRKRTVAQIRERVLSRCFVGCLVQARTHCSNRCCRVVVVYVTMLAMFGDGRSRCQAPKSYPCSRCFARCLVLVCASADRKKRKNIRKLCNLRLNIDKTISMRNIWVGTMLDALPYPSIKRHVPTYNNVIV